MINEFMEAYKGILFSHLLLKTLGIEKEREEEVPMIIIDRVFKEEGLKERKNKYWNLKEYLVSKTSNDIKVCVELEENKRRIEISLCLSGIEFFKPSMYTKEEWKEKEDRIRKKIITQTALWKKLSQMQQKEVTIKVPLKWD